MSRLRGLLPGVLIVVVLPVTLALIVIALGATTLHQNEMRNLIAGHDQRAASEAAAGLDERISHQLVSLHSIAEGVALGLSPVDELRSSDNLLSDFDGGVVVIDEGHNLIAALPQPADPKFLADLNQVAARLQSAYRDAGYGGVVVYLPEQDLSGGNVLFRVVEGKIASVNVAAATEDLRVQQERYRVGAGTILDLLTSQAALTQAQTNLVQARFNYLIARAQLEALVGRSL